MTTTKRSIVEAYHELVAPRLTVEAVYHGVKWRSRSGKQWRGACPLHGGNGPNFVVNVETLQWWCHSGCQTGGGPLEFVHGGKGPEGADFARAVAELAERVGVDLERDDLPVQVPAAAPRPKRHKPEPPKYPPPAEVRALFEACIPVDRDRAVEEYLESRHIDPQHVADERLALALPESAVPPSWAWFGKRPWSQSSHRLIVPLFDDTGAVRSVIARSVDRDIDPRWKSVATRGFNRGGLSMQTDLARLALRRRELPDWWAPDATFRVVVAEGEIDFLIWATRAANFSERFPPAVVGIFANGRVGSFANRLPAGTTVTIATDHDEAGHRYAEALAENLPPTMKAERWQLPR